MQVKGRNELSPLEAAIVDVLAEERVVRQDRLPFVLCVSEEEIDTAAQCLVGAGVVERKHFLYEEPAPWAWLSREGVKLSPLARRAGNWYYIPKVSDLEHADGLVKARIHYLREYPNAQWVPERVLRRRYVGSMNRHRGDGLVEIPLENDRVKAIMVEMELNAKGRRHLLQIIEWFANNEELDEIHYLVGSKRKAEVESTIASAGNSGLDVSRLKVFDVPHPAGLA